MMKYNSRESNMWQTILPVIYLVSVAFQVSGSAAFEPVAFPLRSFNADETRAILQSRLPAALVDDALQLISDAFFNNGTTAMDVDTQIGFGLARLRNWNATTETNTQVYVTALKQYLHSKVNVSELASAFVKFALGKDERELSDGRNQVTQLLIKGAQSKVALRAAGLNIINPFICHDPDTLNRGAIRNKYWSRLPLPEANIAIEATENALLGALNKDNKKGVENHIIFIADGYLALYTLKQANITDAYYTNTFTKDQLYRMNIQLVEQQLPLDDVHAIEDALSYIVDSKTDAEMNRGYFKILQLLTNGVLAESALGEYGNSNHTGLKSSTSVSSGVSTSNHQINGIFAFVMAIVLCLKM